MEQKACERKETHTLDPIYFLVFSIQTNHRNALVRQYTRSGNVHHNEITKAESGNIESNSIEMRQQIKTKSSNKQSNPIEMR